MKEGQKGTGQQKLDRHDKLFLETPFLHVLFEPVLFILKPIMRVFYAMRWGCLRPLNASLIPLGLPYLDAPGLRWLSFVSIGQCLLALPIFALVGTFFFCFTTLFLSSVASARSNIFFPCIQMQLLLPSQLLSISIWPRPASTALMGCTLHF